MNSSTTLESYIAKVQADADARHAAADSILFNSAGFYFDGSRYVIEVRGMIVANFKKVSEVKAFSWMHNSRISGNE